MQVFIRDLQGKSHGFAVQVNSDLSHALGSLGYSSDDTSLSYRSRPVSLAHSEKAVSLPPYATLDVQASLRGGAPKKRCAHTFRKSVTAPPSNAASTSLAVNTGSASSGVQQADATAPQEQLATTIDSSSNATTAIEAEPIPLVSATMTSSEPAFERCSSAALRMVGECPRCTKNFCGAHRLPEDHACPALAGFRKQAFDENRAKLEKEATTSSKISAF